MNIQCHWKEKLHFTAKSEHHQVEMDTKSPLGSDSALSPKQLLLAAISGCTAMDVVSLLKKFHQPLESLTITADATPTEGVYPPIFKSIQLDYQFTGELDQDKVMQAVSLSQTKYCGVSAMIAKAVPITYVITLNGVAAGSGKADFESTAKT